MSRTKPKPKPSRPGLRRSGGEPPSRPRRVLDALPPPNPYLEATWERGASEADIEPVRVAVRNVHKKRLAEIVRRTGLDQQTVLNRAIAAAWEALHMNGAELSDALAKLRKQRSPAGATVTLRPTIQTRRVLRQAAHPQARAILLQTGLNLWDKARP